MTNVLPVIFAFLFPPLAVFLRVGASFHFLLSIVLTLIGYIPGVLHALWLLYTSDEANLAAAEPL